MNNLLKVFAVFLILVSTSCTQEELIDSPTESKKANKSTVDVFIAVNGTNVGTSTLHRNKNGITVNFKTKELIPGNAYTLWWVIWNNPNECGIPGQCTDTDFPNGAAIELDVLYAAGHIVGASGTGNFSAHLRVGDASGSAGFFGLPGIGLNDSYEAEVHLVLRSHGPAQPGMTADQIHTYGGGCTTDPGGFGPDTSEEGHCRDIQAAIHAPVN